MFETYSESGSVKLRPFHYLPFHRALIARVNRIRQSWYVQVQRTLASFIVNSDTLAGPEARMMLGEHLRQYLPALHCHNIHRLVDECFEGKRLRQPDKTAPSFETVPINSLRLDELGCHLQLKPDSRTLVWQTDPASSREFAGYQNTSVAQALYLTLDEVAQWGPRTGGAFVIDAHDRASHVSRYYGGLGVHTVVEIQNAITAAA